MICICMLRIQKIRSPTIQYANKILITIAVKETRKYKIVTLNVRPKLHRMTIYGGNKILSDEFFYTACFNVEDENITEHLQYIDYPGPGLSHKEIDKNLTWDLDGASVKYLQIIFMNPSDSVFNIINETSWEDGCSYNEKLTMHYVIISLVTGYMAAHSLERIGFDMFRYSKL